jgi:cytochrome o ubiquinol oxidase subunit 2
VNKKQKITSGVIIVVVLGILAGAVVFFRSFNVAVLNPQGIIASQERGLIVFTVLLSLIVVIPVFVLLGVFAWKYRENNPKETTYTPNWDGNRTLETVWWGIPCAIILVLCVVTWQTSHQLDPYRALDSTVKPLRVQVVSLQWKWLFIYPDQHVASVNLLEIPEKTPINFQITSDAPMNSFWVPSLGSQVYAMSGMSTQLHLMADGTGDYRGSSANISGSGFADMAFTAHSASSSDFAAWVSKARKAQPLSTDSYTALAKPSTLAQPKQFALQDRTLYSFILNKYMEPAANTNFISGTNTQDDNSSMMNMKGMQ